MQTRRKKPAARPATPSAATKLKAAKSEQASRFIEAAREAGCSEDEAEIRDTMKRLAPVKPEKPAKGR